MKQRIAAGTLLAVLTLGFIFWGIIPVLVAVIIIGSFAIRELFCLLFPCLGTVPKCAWPRRGLSPNSPARNLRPLSFRGALATRNLLFAFGLLFIVAALSTAVVLRASPNGQWWLLLSVAAAACCDTGAFAVGKRFGKHKLAPVLSPGKTLEGTVAGVLCALGATLLIGGKLDMSWPHRIVLGLLLGCAAIAGDLLESAVKRKAGVKDSGALIAGHGGILDRIDSHLLVLPITLLYKLAFFN